jgi:esterase/lipase
MCCRPSEVENTQRRSVIAPLPGLSGNTNSWQRIVVPSVVVIATNGSSVNGVLNGVLSPKMRLASVALPYYAKCGPWRARSRAQLVRPPERFDSGKFANPPLTPSVVSLRSAGVPFFSIQPRALSRGVGMELLPSFTTMWRGAIWILGLAAVMPTSPGDVRAHPRPVKNFADAVRRAHTLIAADDSVVAEGGATILLSHGRRAPRAVVLIHGFTDSPRQFADLADSLFARGDNVLVPRLPHHAERGKDVSELAGLTASELVHTADRAVDIAAGLGDSVVVMGLSVGGTLAAWAGEHRTEVRRAVIIAPPFEATHIPSMLERPIVNISAHVPNLNRRAAPDSARPDRDPGFATHALAQVLRLGMAVRRDAEHPTVGDAEMLFLVNAHDHTVKTAPVLDVAHAWNRRGDPVVVYQIPDSLALPHNIVDPMFQHASVTPVISVLIALAHGERPPAWIAVRR